MSEELEAVVPAAEAAPVPQPEPAAEAPQDADTGQDANPAEDHEGEDASKPKGGFQRRISELTYRVRDTERDRDYWRDMAMRQPQQSPQPQEYTEPQYDGYEGQAQQIDPNAIISQVEAKLELRNKAQSFHQRVADAFPEGSEGVDALMRAPPEYVTREIFDLVTDSAIAPKVAEHLGLNQTELRRLAALPPHKQGFEFAKLEARLAEQKPAQTKATAPPPAIGVRAGPVEKDPDKMTTDEWLKWREAQLRKG